MIMVFIVVDNKDCVDKLNLVNIRREMLDFLLSFIFTV